MELASHGLGLTNLLVMSTEPHTPNRYKIIEVFRFIVVLPMIKCTCMAINVSDQYSGGFSTPDIILLALSNNTTAGEPDYMPLRGFDNFSS